MFDVVWDSTNKPGRVPANEACAHLMKHSPVAVGTTPMDAIMAYVSGHVSQPDSDKDSTDPRKVEEVLLKLQTLLLDREGGVESQRKALDMVSNLDFGRVDGGKQHFLADTKTPADKGQANSKVQLATTFKAREDDIQAIKVLNQQQHHLDALSRHFSKTQWDLFAAWWKLLTESPSVDREAGATNHETVRSSLVDLLGSINNSSGNVQGAVDKSKSDVKTKTGVDIQTGSAAPFYQGSDPTLLVAGISSGWPLDYTKPLMVRLRHQLVGANGEPIGSTAPPLDKYLQDILEGLGLSEDTKTDLSYLLTEFSQLRSDLGTWTNKNGGVLPLYHDPDNQNPDKNKLRFRDRWHDTQAWFPLFMEWEAVYVHIPWEYWEMDNGDSTARLSADKKVRYQVQAKALLPDQLGGQRTISGRVLLLPQPNFSLATKIRQLLAEASPAELKLTDDDKKELKQHIDQLQFLSAPLTGFAHHLVTKRDGTHVKPTYTEPGRSQTQPSVTKAKSAAREAATAKGARYEDDHLVLMGHETNLTPYGTGVQFTKTDACPFKPVTHGQFCFTKLNIIDKFGQVAHALAPGVNDGRVPLRPFISEYYNPQRLFTAQAADKLTHTEAKKNQTPPLSVASADEHYEFIQLPPQINQFARLNASFVTLQSHKIPGPPDHQGNATEIVETYWQPVGQWENPVWGWVVLNYANYGVQFFFPDGSFFCEVRRGGPTGAQALSTRWLPRGRQVDEAVLRQPETQQLQNLLKVLSEGPSAALHLQAFIDMVNGAMSTMFPPPSAYAEFLGSLVGPPLALVNMGWSLELAQQPAENHAVSSTLAPPIVLLDPATTKPQPRPQPSPRSSTSLPTYSFPLKLGDQLKPYDGLLGYWDQLPPSSPLRIPGNALDFRTLHTYYYHADPPLPESAVITPITNKTFPSLPPTWKNPISLSSSDYHLERCRFLHGFGAVVDPFTPVHGYTGGVLPTAELRLPSRTWQEAFEKMTCFFEVGPVVVVEDVPGLGAEVTQVGETIKGKVGNKPYEVSMPSLSAAKWSWMQPYFLNKKGEEGRGSGSTGTSSVEYRTYGVKPVDSKPRFQPSPYTALDGYLEIQKVVWGPEMAAVAGAGDGGRGDGGGVEAG